MTTRRHVAIALLAGLALIWVVSSAIGRRDPPPTARRHAHTTARRPRSSAASATSPTTSCRWRRFADGAIGTDPECAPGALDGTVRGRVAQTICNRSWLAAANSLAPASSTRNRLLIEYSLPGNPVTYAIARVVPVQDGGSPTSARNLYPLPIDGFGGQRTRAAVAERLHDEICSHDITIAQAARMLEGDWLRHGLPDDD